MRGEKQLFFRCLLPDVFCLFRSCPSRLPGWYLISRRFLSSCYLQRCHVNCVWMCVCVCFKTSSSSSSPPLSSHVSNSFTVTDPCHWHTKALAGGVIRHIHTVSVTHTFYTNTHGVMWIFLLLLLYWQQDPVLHLL